MNTFIKLGFVGNMIRLVEKFIDMKICVACLNYVNEEIVVIINKYTKEFICPTCAVIFFKSPQFFKIFFIIISYYYFCKFSKKGFDFIIAFLFSSAKKDLLCYTICN